MATLPGAARLYRLTAAAIRSNLTLDERADFALELESAFGVDHVEYTFTQDIDGFSLAEVKETSVTAPTSTTRLTFSSTSVTVRWSNSGFVQNAYQLRLTDAGGDILPNGTIADTRGLSPEASARTATSLAVLVYSATVASLTRAGSRNVNPIDGHGADGFRLRVDTYDNDGFADSDTTGLIYFPEPSLSVTEPIAEPGSMAVIATGDGITVRWSTTDYTQRRWTLTAVPASGIPTLLASSTGAASSYAVTNSKILSIPVAHRSNFVFRVNSYYNDHRSIERSQVATSASVRYTETADSLTITSATFDSSNNLTLEWSRAGVWTQTSYDVYLIDGSTYRLLTSRPGSATTYTISSGTIFRNIAYANLNNFGVRIRGYDSGVEKGSDEETGLSYSTPSYTTTVSVNDRSPGPGDSLTVTFSTSPAISQRSYTWRIVNGSTSSTPAGTVSYLSLIHI